MRCFMFFVLSLSICVVVTWGQTQAPTPTSTPGGRNTSPVISDNARFDRLRSIEMMNANEQASRHPLLDPKKGIYRRPGKEEISALAVEPRFHAEFGSFLKASNTGILRLNSNIECVTDIDTVSASETCIPFRMPGAGIAYSFRTESYRLPRLADLILLDGTFRTGGVFQQVFMAELGDVAIDQGNLTSQGLKFLVDLKPARDSDEFQALEEKIAIGIKADGFVYRKENPVSKNMTYAMRSIAFRGQFMRSIDGIPYNELDFDKRRDVIVVFRVIDWKVDGDPTIIWKILKDSEAPKLKIVK